MPYKAHVKLVLSALVVGLALTAGQALLSAKAYAFLPEEAPIVTNPAEQPNECSTNEALTQYDSLGGCVRNPTLTGEGKTLYQCGNGDKKVMTGINFGCRGTSYQKQLNPIVDIAFAIFRFLSAGVGIVAVGSIIVAGLQYSASRGNPAATQASIQRISNTVVGLIIYMFIFAIANFLIPGGLFTT